MGHGKKNANRGEAIQNNYARIKKLAEKHKELGNHLKDAKRELQDEINEILVVVDEMDEEFKARLTELEERVLFNAQPFWKRWWQTWKKNNELLKDANKPPVVDPLEPIKVKKRVAFEVPLPDPEKKPYEKPTIKEEEMPKKGKVHRLEGHATVKADKLGLPPTPSHRQVVVDRKTPGPKKTGKPDKTKAESRDA